MDLCRPAAALLLSTSLLAAAAGPPVREKGMYRPHEKDPVLKALEEENAAAEKAAQEATQAIVQREEEAAKARRESRPDFVADLSAIPRPKGPEDFALRRWAFPPVAQYLTGTCWSFSTTSFMESEVKRLTGREVKLSEIWTVYWEYVEKARRSVETRGNSVFEEGSEAEAIPRIWKTYGVVPASAYPGVLREDGRHDHELLLKELKAYLAYCKENNFWDEAAVISAVRAILDRTLGPPPQTVAFEGKTYSPKAFLDDVLHLDPDAYVSFISTKAFPFYTRGELSVEDNWWHTDAYVNLPLEAWYRLLLSAVESGSTVCIGGDVSEPGYDGVQKAAVVPSFDIPAAFIDQDAREMRFTEGSTTDDHGVHLVGYTKVADADWFLIKDSARAARKAPPEGWLFYRGDYVRLKMLSYMIHKDFAKEVLAKVR